MSSPDAQHSDWINVPASAPKPSEFLIDEGLPGPEVAALAPVLDELVERLCGPDYENLPNGLFTCTDATELRGIVAGWCSDSDSDFEKTRPYRVGACRDFLLGRGHNVERAVRWASFAWDYVLVIRRHVMAAR